MKKSKSSNDDFSNLVQLLYFAHRNKSYDVDKLRKERNMPNIKIGRSYRYNLEDVEKFIKKLGSK